MKESDINKIGLLHIRNKKLLVVYKTNIGLYITVGGKIEPNETDIECLEREVTEEIGYSMENPAYFETFYETSHSTKSLRIKCYLGQLRGNITLNPQDTIDNYCWIGCDYKRKNIPLGPMLKNQILPELIARGLL